MALSTTPPSAGRATGSTVDAGMKDDKLDMSALDRFLARSVVAFHFSMFSWGTWITIVLAAYWSRLSAAFMTLYLAYIFLYQGNRALQEHVYPQNWRRSVKACCFVNASQTAFRPLLCWLVGLVGREQLRTFQPSCTRQQTLTLLAPTYLLAILMG